MLDDLLTSMEHYKLIFNNILVAVTVNREYTVLLKKVKK